VIEDMIILPWVEENWELI